MDPPVTAVPDSTTMMQALEMLNHRLQHLEQFASNAPAVPASAPSGATRLKPHKPDTYEGKDKDRIFIHDWTFQLNTFYDAVGIAADAERINFAVTLLRGPALRWWRNVDAANRPTTWTDFTTRITTYFLPQGADNSARNQLERLHQRGSVASYTDRFRAITDLISNMSDEEKRVTYTRGLKEQVQLQVAFARPPTFEDTVIQANTIDDILYHHSASRRGGKQVPLRGGGASPSSHNTDMELGSMQGGASSSGGRTKPTNPGTTSGAAPPLSKLSDAERARLRSIGACFRCRQPGHTALQCPLRAKQQGNGRSSQQ